MIILHYNFAKEFSDTPGPRYEKLGPNSAEEFRSELLKLLQTFDYIEIDGTDIKTTFNPSFLAECFGGLAKLWGSPEKVFQKMTLFSRKCDSLNERFKKYTIAEFKNEYILGN